MTWIILGLLALLMLAGITILRRNAAITNLEGRTNDLKGEVERWQTEFRESREVKDATIARLTVDLRELNDHDAGLQAKLEEMHLAAMHFCSVGGLVYFIIEDVKNPWRSRFVSESGSAWYPNRDYPRGPNDAGYDKPTVDEWIKFMNEISSAFESSGPVVNHMKEEKRARVAACRDLSIKFLQNLLNPHQATISGPLGGESDVALEKDLDLRLLQFLEGLGQLIELDHKEDPNDRWGPHGVEAHLLFKTSFTGALLRRKLMDLMKHHNQEYMAIIDRLPSDIAQYFLRLTVAEPVAAAG